MINPLLLILTGIQKPLQRTWRWEKGWRFLRPICPRHFQVKNLISLIWLLWKNECWVLLTCRNYIAHLNIVLFKGKFGFHLRGRLKMSKIQISFFFTKFFCYWNFRAFDADKDDRLSFKEWQVGFYLLILLPKVVLVGFWCFIIHNDNMY